ncbi:MAG: bm3R1 2 [Actinomycetia bacterium]|nr:bm3R1 2 [Actinomycetes bacterium]
MTPDEVVNDCQNLAGGHPDPSGRRATNKRRTRDALEQAAFELFLRDGYDATSVTDIAAAVHVSQRTFFRYFTTKDDVVFCGLDDDVERFVRILRDALRSDTPSWADLSAGIVAFGETYEASRSTHLLRAELVLRTPVLHGRAGRIQAEWRNRAVEVLAARYGLPIADWDIQLLASLTMAVLGAAVIEWIWNDDVLLGDAVRRAAARAPELLGG